MLISGKTYPPTADKYYQENNKIIINHNNICNVTRLLWSLIYCKYITRATIFKLMISCQVSSGENSGAEVLLNMCLDFYSWFVDIEESC